MNLAALLTTRNIFIALFALAVGTIGFVLVSQYGFDYHPCELCLLQRWPWYIMIGLAAIGIRFPYPALLALAALLLLTGAGIAGYHSGVEMKWWPGPSACTLGAGTPKTIEELRAQLLSTPVVLCDQVSWRLFGLSMATYNFLMSLAAGIAVSAATLKLLKARNARP